MLKVYKVVHEIEYCYHLSECIRFMNRNGILPFYISVDICMVYRMFDVEGIKVLPIGRWTFFQRIWGSLSF